jgi:hypothetical protein
MISLYSLLHSIYFYISIQHKFCSKSRNCKNAHDTTWQRCIINTSLYYGVERFFTHFHIYHSLRGLSHASKWYLSRFGIGIKFTNFQIQASPMCPIWHSLELLEFGVAIPEYAAGAGSGYHEVECSVDWFLLSSWDNRRLYSYTFFDL